MDTTLIFFIIFGIILWVDNKRRNARILERKQSVITFNPVKPEQPIGQDMNDIEDMLKVIAEFINEDKKNDSENADMEAEKVLDDIDNDDIEPVDNTHAVNDTILALSRLKYKKNEISKTISSIMENVDYNISTEELLKLALNKLNK